MDQPMVGEHVVLENLAELRVRDALHRPVVGIGSRVADQNVDPAESAVRLVDEALKLLLDEMLAAIGFAASRPRARLMASAVSAQASALRDEMTTLAPCSASRSAMARPMPREEPVTIATRPVKSKRLVKAPSPAGRAPQLNSGVSLPWATTG